jgi:hypothetical protein
MAKILTIVCTKKWNFFPPKGGVSPYYRPQMILHQQSLDYNKHCSIPFLAYVQAHHEPDPKYTQHPQTLDCIYLRFTDNEQGGHHLLYLQMGGTIKRRTDTSVLITENVIDLVHNMADIDNMPDGLKFETKAGVFLYDSSWISRLYCDNDENDSDNVYDDNNSDEDHDNYIITMDPNKVGDILDGKYYNDDEKDDNDEASRNGANNYDNNGIENYDENDQDKNYDE